MLFLKKVLPLLFISANVFSQTVDPMTTTKKGAFYFTWGYHRDQYTQSTIRFVDQSTDHYDFTFHKAKAKDQPDFGDFFDTRLTVPQYVANLGYFFNDKHDLGIEVSWDHLKYVVIDNQMIHMTGNIRGKQYDLDTLVTPSFVHYEHTNGNNYGMVSLVKRKSLFHSANSSHGLRAIFKVGVGVLIPKTDSMILGGHNDGPFKVSGGVLGVSAGLRYDLFKYFYIESNIKGAFVDYTSVKLINDGKAHQKFGSIQYIFAFGINVPL